MPNEQYQSLFGASEEVGPRRRCSTGSTPDARAALERAARRLRGRRCAHARPRPRRPRPRRHPRRAPAGARDDRSPDGDLRVHDQGLRPRDRRPAAEPLGAARPASRSTGSARDVRPDARDGVGRVRRRHARGAAARAARAAARPRRSRRPPRRSSVPPTLSTRDPARDVDAGGLRADRCSTSRASTGVAERLVTVAPDVSVVHQPRRLHQQGRRLGPRRGAGLRRDGGLAAELARRAARASTSRWASRR